MTQRYPNAIGAIAAIAALACALPAAAQNALDANPRVGSGGLNSATRSFNEELAFRNSIVTGNVASGRQFRGNVGYTAPFDFRGATAVNDQFAFRADAYYSGLATRDLRGLDTLRRQFGDTTFGQTGAGGGLIINRPGSGVSAANLTPVAGAQRIAELDSFNGTLRSLSASRLRNDLQPELMARFVNEVGETRLITSSEIDGVRVLAPTQRELDKPAPPPNRQDRSRPAAELVDSNLSPHAILLESLRREAIRKGALIRGSEQQEADPAAPDELRPPTPDDGDGGADNLINPTRAPQPMTIEEMLDRMRTQLEPNPRNTTQADPAADPDAPELTPLQEALQEIGADLPPQSLVNPGGDPADRYLGHMARGQELLNEGRWFDAEERFTMALGHRPGDAMAAAGRIHAQIGAGMFRSAAINIRNLYRAYPEMIPVRFEAELIPRGERLVMVERQLAERSRLDTGFALDASLVMAYLGHQKNDPALRDAGFARIREISKSIGAQTDPLIELMEHVWTDN